jgi:group I intron endonuclease
VEALVKTSIYKITNLQNEKVYIGQSVDPEKRWKQHKTGVGSRAVSEAIKKYGLDSFSFEVLCWTDTSQADAEEEKLIKEFDSYRNGYNLTIGGGGVRVLEASTYEKIFLLLKNTSKKHEEIAEEVGVGFTTISFVNNGKRYRQEGEIYPLRKTSDFKSSFYLTEEEVLLIEDRLFKLQSIVQVAKELELSRTGAIFEINRGNHEFSKRESYPIVKPRKATKEEVREIEGYMEANPELSLKEIAKIFGREREMIGKINRGVHNYSSQNKKYPIR